MRIDPRQTVTAKRPGHAAKARGSGFAPAGAETAAQSSAVAGARPAAAAGSLIAVQSLLGEDIAERRRKAVRRGHRLLDVLDEIKIALLSGQVPATQLLALKSALSEAKAGGLEAPELQDVLDAVDLRARVELAKLGKG